MASVSKRRWKKPDGSMGETWIVRYKDGDAHPQKTFPLKKEAEAFKRKVETEIEAGTHVSRRSSRTVAELVKEFTTSLERREADGQISFSYVDQTTRALRYAAEDMGELVLADLRWQRVEEFGQRLRQRRSMHGGRPFSNATINVVLGALRSAIDYGVRRGYAVKNVARDAMKEIGALPAKRITPFSLIEMKAVIGAIEEPRTRAAPRGQALIRAAVYLGTMCGLRRGEIMGLTWEDVKLDRGLLVIKRSLNMRDVLKSTKTGDKGERTIPLPAIVAQALEAWRPFVVPEPRGLIFRTRTGGIIRASDFYADLWHPVLSKAGLPAENGRWRHFHATRHFAGSAWLDGGVPLPEVSRLMGHANMQVTARIYSHAIAEVHHRAAQLDACASSLTHGIAQQRRIAA